MGGGGVETRGRESEAREDSTKKTLLYESVPLLCGHGIVNSKSVLAFFARIPCLTLCLVKLSAGVLARD